MPQPSHLDPRPFFLEGGPVGALLIHGFTGCPAEMRLVADYLHSQGCTVSAPLLAGHGTTPDDMNCRKWTEWTEDADRALAELNSRCETVFVAGLSMGSLLALYLAVEHPQLAGAIIYSPALMVNDRAIRLSPFLKHLVAKKHKSSKADTDLTDPEAQLRLWNYDELPLAAAHELLKLIALTERLLPQVTCPLLVIYSTSDKAIHQNSAPRTYERAGSKDKELVTLHNSGHCLTVDIEWKSVAAKTYEFIRAHTPQQYNRRL